MVTETFPRAKVLKVPYMELLLSGTFVPWNFSFQELSFPGTFASLSKNEVEIRSSLRVNIIGIHT